MSSRDLRNAACEYAARGWALIPLQAGAKQPIGRLVRNGKDDATADLSTVFRWWQHEAPGANIAIVANASGLAVLDIDPRNGGDETLHELIGLLGVLPATVEAFTGGGGQHLIFRHPGCSLRGSLGPGIEVKDHGYIVAPPSLHPSGRRYEWSVDGHPDDIEPAELPEAWLEKMRVPDRLVFERLDTHEDPLRNIPAAVYVPKLLGREPGRDGFLPCPFHGGGEERTPSFKVDGTLWACFACPPMLGQVLGGNIYTLAGLVRGLALPLRGYDFTEVSEWLKGMFL